MGNDSSDHICCDHFRSGISLTLMCSEPIMTAWIELMAEAGFRSRETFFAHMLSEERKRQHFLRLQEGRRIPRSDPFLMARASASCLQSPGIAVRPSVVELDAVGLSPVNLTTPSGSSLMKNAAPICLDDFSNQPSNAQDSFEEDIDVVGGLATDASTDTAELNADTHNDVVSIFERLDPEDSHPASQGRTLGLAADMNTNTDVTVEHETIELDQNPRMQSFVEVEEDDPIIVPFVKPAIECIDVDDFDDCDTVLFKADEIVVTDDEMDADSSLVVPCAKRKRVGDTNLGRSVIKESAFSSPTTVTGLHEHVIKIGGACDIVGCSVDLNDITFGKAPVVIQPRKHKKLRDASKRDKIKRKERKAHDKTSYQDCASGTVAIQSEILDKSANQKEPHECSANQNEVQEKTVNKDCNQKSPGELDVRRILTNQKEYRDKSANQKEPRDKSVNLKKSRDKCSNHKEPRDKPISQKEQRVRSVVQKVSRIESVDQDRAKRIEPHLEFNDHEARSRANPLQNTDSPKRRSKSADQQLRDTGFDSRAHRAKSSEPVQPSFNPFEIGMGYNLPESRNEANSMDGYGEERVRVKEEHGDFDYRKNQRIRAIFSDKPRLPPLPSSALVYRGSSSSGDGFIMMDAIKKFNLERLMNNPEETGSVPDNDKCMERFTCNKCSAVFKRKSDLYQHELEHIEKRSFELGIPPPGREEEPDRREFGGKFHRGFGRGFSRCPRILRGGGWGGARPSRPIDDDSGTIRRAQRYADQVVHKYKQYRGPQTGRGGGW